MVPNNEYTEIRDAVIKLETKMESMSDSMEKLADSVVKIADVRYDILAIQKDVSALKDAVNNQHKDIDKLFTRQRDIESVQLQHAFVVKKVNVFWTAVVTGAVSFFWWVIKN